MDSDVMLHKYGKARQEQFIQQAEADRIRAEINTEARERAQQRSSFAFGRLWWAIRRMFRFGYNRDQIEEPS